MPDGYACVRVDARGWGRSPGYIDLRARARPRICYDCIEWAAAQPWSTARSACSASATTRSTSGRRGLQPPHLAAMIPWEGFADFYRDFSYHGGIASDMKNVWYRRTITTVQHGLGERAATNPITGAVGGGPETLDRRGARREPVGLHRGHRAPIRSTTTSTATARRTSSGSRCRSCRPGTGAAPRCTCAATSRGSCRPASEQKWLEIHGLEHWTEFYTDYGVGLQKRFFDHFLKGEDNGWDTQPPRDAARAHRRRRVPRSRRGRVADRADATGRRCTSIRRQGRSVRSRSLRRAGELLDALERPGSRC